ncbi:MAG: hypothetical protein WAW41_11870 [Methylobacter sp.]
MKTRCSNPYWPFALLWLMLLSAAGAYAAGETSRISVDSTGVEGNEYSIANAISADGRYVAFSSDAENLVPGDSNGWPDIFVYDRLTRTTSLVSVDSAGEQRYRASYDPSISADGRYVLFVSTAPFVPEDTNKWVDVFAHDRLTGTTTRVSLNSDDQQAIGGSSRTGAFSISADGRYVAFNSIAANLVPGDTNGLSDVFVRDRLTGATTRVSVDSAGMEGNAGSERNKYPAISADGRYVAFTSLSDNLVPGDTNEAQDVFVHDRTTGSTARVSVDSSGLQATGHSQSPALSASGRYVAFSSDADNLVPGDTNGHSDVFVRDRTGGTTRRVSVDWAGGQIAEQSYVGAISADGRYVAFYSMVSNLLPGDADLHYDTFVHDLTTGATSLVSLDSAGQRGNGSSTVSSISADGRHVAFASTADNLVPWDTNHYNDVFVRDRLLNTSQNADLQLAVTSQPDSVQNGEIGRYIFTISNNGPDSAGSVNLVDVVSEGKVWSLTPSQGDCEIAAVSVCRLDSLAAGASATVRAVFKAKGDSLTQQVSVSAAPADSEPANNALTVSAPSWPWQ